MKIFLDPISQNTFKDLRQSTLEQIAYLNTDYSTSATLYENVANVSYLRGQLELVDSILSASLPLTLTEN